MQYDSQRTGGSRFSQWFANGRSRSNSLKTSSRNNSRRSSLTDELAEIAGNFHKLIHYVYSSLHNMVVI